jgi:DNA-binding NtrC family response regulator
VPVSAILVDSGRIGCSKFLKFLAFTPKRHTQDAVLCRKAGAYNWLTKPLDPHDVVEIVARAVRNEPVISADFALSP